MKKRGLCLILSIASLLLITGCGEEEQNDTPTPPEFEPTLEEVSLDSFTTLLSGDFYKNEVSLASKESTTTTIDTDNGSQLDSRKEELYIYNDNVSIARGEVEVDYENDEHDAKDSYTLYLGIVEETNNDYLYRVVEYDDGTKRSSWANSAERILVLDKVNSSLTQDEDYILRSDSAAQLTNQSSLYIYNFVVGNLLNNTDLAMSSLPKIIKTTYEDRIEYVFDLYQYNYEEEGDTITNGYEFKVVTDLENKLTYGETILHYTQERIDEVYNLVTTNIYEIEYDERVASSTSNYLLNPHDYFLTKVNDIRGYYYGSGYQEVDVSLTALPLNRYIWFEASSYEPSKAIDLKLTPIESNNTRVIEINNENIYTVGGGRATVTFVTNTGIEIIKDLIVEDVVRAESISYSDVSSGIEIDYDSDYNRFGYIYTNTTYSNIRVSGNPTGVLKSDIAYEITKGSDLIELTDKNTSTTFYDFSLKVLDTAKEGNEVSIRFYSISNPLVEEVVKYKVKERLSVDELKAKLLASEYNWESLYGDEGGKLKFTSETTFEVTYYSNFENLTSPGTNTYSFVLNEEDFTMTVTRLTTSTDYGTNNTNYDEGKISLDGNHITFYVNETDYVHNFYIGE